MTTLVKPIATESTATEADLLARLGLGRDANSQEIEAAHDELVEYLEAAPHDLRRWAQRQIAAADEAYALLADPSVLRPSSTGTATVVPMRAPGKPPQAPRPAAPVPSPATGPDDEIFEELEEEPPLTRRARRRADRRNAAAARGEVARAPGFKVRRGTLRQLGLVVGAIVAVGAILFVGYNLGSSNIPGVSGSPAPETAASPAIDPAQVTALMQKIASNPKDIASLQALGDLYYQGGDYKTAGDWEKKVLAIDPKNITALLADGAGLFNLGDLAGAESDWRQVLAQDANNIEAHYDLGFMYLSKNPPDIANVKLEWNKVIAISPNSDIAQTVATHLQSLEGSPAPSGAPTSAAPSEPAASPGPSGK